MTYPRLRATKDIERVMVQVARWRMVDENMSPYLLPYDAFTKVWWDREANGESSKQAKMLLDQLDRSESEALQRERDNATVIIPKAKQQILLHFPHSDHGLHILRSVLSESDFQRVWSFMNRSRRKIAWGSDISIEKLNRKMKVCTKCKQKIGFSEALSPMGIYYAPPGVGKTTALNQGDIVAFDTDWVGLGSTWRDYSPILRMNIPIITNQYTAFRGSGLKVLGVIKDKIRLDSRGKPFTTLKILEDYQDENPQDVTFITIAKDEYLAHYAQRLKIMQHMSKIIVGYSINMLPFYRNEQTPEWARKYPQLIRKAVT